MSKAKKERQLRFWNGGAAWMRKGSDPFWSDVYFNASPHAYVAAYSRIDARRVIAEYTGSMPSDTEIRDYWSECWGIAMDGIEPVRGMWLARWHNDKPVKVV